VKVSKKIGMNGAVGKKRSAKENNPAQTASQAVSPVRSASAQPVGKRNILERLGNQDAEAKRTEIEEGEEEGALDSSQASQESQVHIRKINIYVNFLAV
jgi:hypothetical protein